MKRFVIDASVAVQSMAPEEHTRRALALIAGAEAMHAPGHWLAEAANALGAMFAVRGVITRDQMSRRIAALAKLSVSVTPVAELIQQAGDISASLRMSIYDSLYIALAWQLDLPLVTADRRLIERTRASKFEPLTHWIGSIG